MSRLVLLCFTYSNVIQRIRFCVFLSGSVRVVAFIGVFTILFMLPTRASFADVFGSAERRELIKMVLKFPQIVVDRGSDNRFRLKYCRCPVYVDFSQIPAHLRLALVATEDKGFYDGFRINRPVAKVHTSDSRTAGLNA